MPLQIGIDASRAARAERTGTEQYTVALLAALSGLDHYNQYRLYVNTLPRQLPPLGANFTLRHIPLRRLWTHARLSAELLREAPDVLFVPAHVLPFPGALRPEMPSVVTVHDLGYLHFPEAHTASQRLYLRLSTAWNARIACAVIAVSEATRSDLLAHTGVDAQKVHVVQHGVSSRFAPQSEQAVAAARECYGIPPRYFLYVGTIQPRKNLARLLRAYAQARREAADFPALVIAGRVGWRSEGIAATAQALGIGAHLHFPGYVADADLPALLSGAEAFVYPSLFEGFGMPILEAMACGTPVLAANTSSIPEVAGNAALLLDPLDERAIAKGLLRLATNGNARHELRERGLARAQHFNWERCARETLAVLRSAAGQSHAVAAGERMR